MQPSARRRFLLLAATTLLAACSTTSTVQQPRTGAALVGEKYRYTFVDQAGPDAVGTGELDAAIRARLQSAGVLAASGETATPVQVTLVQYRMRSGGARFWAGAMAGRDVVHSKVRVGAGADAGSFDVETSNVTAWGTTGGLLEKHADEILAGLGTR